MVDEKLKGIDDKVINDVTPPADKPIIPDTPVEPEEEIPLDLVEKVTGELRSFLGRRTSEMEERSQERDRRMLEMIQNMQDKTPEQKNDDFLADPATTTQGMIEDFITNKDRKEQEYTSSFGNIAAALIQNDPILKNNSIPWRQAWLYEYFKEFPYQVPEMNAVRTEQYKYIEYKGNKSTNLFDIINDPNEKKNLINTAEGQKLIPELKKMLEELKEGKAL